MYDEAQDSETLLVSARMLLRRLENLGRAAKARNAEMTLLDQIARATSTVEGVVQRLGGETGGPGMPGRVAQQMLGSALAEEAPGGLDLYAGDPSDFARQSQPQSQSPTSSIDAVNRSQVARAPQGDSVHDLRGSSAVVELPEVLELLASQGKTGILEVETETEEITIHLREGKLVHAASNGAPEGDRLGDLLVSMGFVSRDRLSAFLKGFAGSGRLLGEVLATGSVVSPEELQAALAEQVQRLFHRIFQARGSRYRFTPSDVDSGRFQRVDLGLRFLLFESARHLDETRAEAR
ncbi:MAG: DUF4388 domain-containing protein [Planctomycetota bacterium]